MRRNAQFLVWGFFVVATVAIAAVQSTSSPRPAVSQQVANQQAANQQPANQQSAEQQNGALQGQPGQAGGVLKANTRLVTVDVVATDTHGAIIRDLKPEDFEISDHGSQKIDEFAFIDKSADAAAKAVSADSSSSVTKSQPRPKGFYTNQPADFAAPPTVILLDSLNSTSTNMLESRRHMLQLLKTFPSGTPVAVMLLDQSLRVVQDFSSDATVLRAAVDRALTPGAGPEPAPEDNPNSLSLMAYDENEQQENDESQTMENFEMETYAEQMDIRVDTTADALNAIAHYLSAYPGRKNLIWLSESFPIMLWPDLDYGDTTRQYATYLKSARSYQGQLQDATNALSDAQVAVYPVDIRGLQTPQVLVSSTQQGATRQLAAARSTAAQLRRESQTRLSSQQSMDALAEGSGGKTCENTNDLSGCVESALGDSSSYYELAYYPDNLKWDGSFHTISLKVNRSGVKLAYRRGYFAVDADAAAKEDPTKRLQQACQDMLPSTSIPVAAQAAAPIAADRVRYRVTIGASGLTALPSGHSYQVNAEMGNCVYKPDGKSFEFSTRDLTQTLSALGYQRLQANGMSGYVQFPATESGRIRIVVLDETNGQVGALDLIVRKSDFADLAPSEASPAPASKTPGQN